MSVNKVILIGNVGKDPEVRYIENGTPVCTLPVATSESYVNKAGERVTTTEWHNVVLWRSLAEVAQKYVKKGTQVYVEGRIRSRSYDDKDGNKRYTTEIIAYTFQLLGRRQDDATGVATGAASPEVASEVKEPLTSEDFALPPSESDDLPF
ncbi:MAG TPA: single-stranded DNA-binding protein [Bacteroidales bacterium]|nr:single-stranded DNA-binding protein [Bacteroidales bacterium]HOK97692.1 single-stranded DNA-binding protein [Bacteroidales bacterium]HPO65399.1 single-stranded DNA-binding protein [Bacteroidales bacterium]